MVGTMSLLRPLFLLIPALIPSWRFFRAVAASPRVEVSPAGADAWEEVMRRPAQVSLWQMLRRMVWNPDRAEALFLVSLSERVVEDGSAHAMRDLQRRVMRRYPGQRVQLRLVFVERQGAVLVREVLYQSGSFGGAD